MVDFEITATGTDEDVSITYYAYIRRDSDGLYLDSDDSTFKSFANLVDGTFDFTEDSNQPGLWQLTVDMGSREGTFTLLPRNGETDVLLQDEVETFYILDGDRLVDPREDRVALYEDYGGIDNLQLVDGDGVPVEGATISVYRKVDYDVEDFDKILSVTQTTDKGYWAEPVFVPVGDTYVIVYYKDNEIGTTTIEVTVP